MSWKTPSVIHRPRPTHHSKATWRTALGRWPAWFACPPTGSSRGGVPLGAPPSSLMRPLVPRREARAAPLASRGRCLSLPEASRNTSPLHRRYLMSITPTRPAQPPVDSNATPPRQAATGCPAGKNQAELRRVSHTSCKREESVARGEGALGGQLLEREALAGMQPRAQAKLERLSNRWRTRDPGLASDNRDNSGPACVTGASPRLVATNDSR